MLYPPVADLLKNVDSRYLLVNVVAQRARQIAEEAEAMLGQLAEYNAELQEIYKRFDFLKKYDKCKAQPIRNFFSSIQSFNISPVLRCFLDNCISVFGFESVYIQVDERTRGI